MKIRKISFQNHPILKDLDLDFTDNGKTVDSLIIAGENGVGKSLILNCIYSFSNRQMPEYRSKEIRVFEIELSQDELKYVSQKNVNGIYRITLDYNYFQDFRGVSFSMMGINNEWLSLGHNNIIKQTANPLIKAIFSDIEVNFVPGEIKNVTSTNIDIVQASERSSKNLATEITQLLIDIQSLDALEFSEWARDNIGSPIKSSQIDKRIKRFTNAFEYMFPSKRYKKIITSNKGKEIIFEDNGTEMSLSQLSSGEKQVVFRGSFLLKNKQSSKGALVLIDEPEISLHPKWQIKILNFFKKLFTDEQGKQTSQIIVSTHSPFILHNYNRKDDKVIVLQKDSLGNVFVPTDPKFYSWTTEKIVQHAFDINNLTHENSTTVFVEGETDEKYFNKCIEIFDLQTNNLIIKWIGRINDSGTAENSGDTALNNAKTFFCANNEFVKSKIVLLYDNDTKKPLENLGNLFIRQMTQNKQNEIFKVGIENLLHLPKDFDLKQFYKTRKKTDNYGAKSIISELNKSALCNFICDNVAIHDQIKILENLKIEIEKILII